VDYLDQIVRYKREHRTAPAPDLERTISDAPPAQPSFCSLGTFRTVVIAECKKASPSKGLLVESGYDPVGLAREYEEAGAFAISVLTDEHFFQGSSRDLVAVKSAVELPVLRKDFVLDERDLLEARAMGADIVLLIARILDESMLRELLRASAGLGMEALVEVHNENEVHRALAAGALLIGINNRDLSSFVTDIEVTERLLPLIPAQVSAISESGIATGAQVARLREAGVRGVLVGEALIRAANPGMLLRELVDAGCPDCWKERVSGGASKAGEPVGLPVSAQEVRA
jgi:indole-3-glycerol phosphate synthase